MAISFAFLFGGAMSVFWIVTLICLQVLTLALTLTLTITLTLTLSVFWIVTLICLQVRVGGVGREPGCPAPCRCCCPDVKQRRANKTTARDNDTATAGDDIHAV